MAVKLLVEWARLFEHHYRGNHRQRLGAAVDLDTSVLSDDCSTLYYADLSEVTFAFATQ